MSPHPLAPTSTHGHEPARTSLAYTRPAHSTAYGSDKPELASAPLHADEDRSAQAGSRVQPLFKYLLWLLVLAACFSLLTQFWDVDLATARYWRQPTGGWFGGQSTLCAFLNDYGPLPAALLAAGAALTIVGAAFHPSWNRLRRPSLYLLLVYLIGPGLLINGVLKHASNRARPKDVIEFGGREHYERLFADEPLSVGRSFPSGHASAAFSLCSLGFAAAGWGRRAHVAPGLLIGTASGILVSWSRVASGAHFLSDVLWSATLVNMVNAGVLALMMRRHR